MATQGARRIGRIRAFKNAWSEAFTRQIGHRAWRSKVNSVSENMQCGPLCRVHSVHHPWSRQCGARSAPYVECMMGSGCVQYGTPLCRVHSVHHSWSRQCGARSAPYVECMMSSEYVQYGATLRRVHSVHHPRSRLQRRKAWPRRASGGFAVFHPLWQCGARSAPYVEGMMGSGCAQYGATLRRVHSVHHSWSRP